MTESTRKNADSERLCQATQAAWNTKEPSVVMQLLNPEAVWRRNGQVHVGRGEIWKALADMWAEMLHYRQIQAMISQDTNSIDVGYEAEWQHAVNGRWFRRVGTGTYVADDALKIIRFETCDSDQPITAAERRLAIALNERIHSKNERTRG